MELSLSLSLAFYCREFDEQIKGMMMDDLKSKYVQPSSSWSLEHDSSLNAFLSARLMSVSVSVSCVYLSYPIDLLGCVGEGLLNQVNEDDDGDDNPQAADDGGEEEANDGGGGFSFSSSLGPVLDDLDLDF